MANLVPSKTSFIVTPADGVMDTRVLEEEEPPPPPTDTALAAAAAALADGEYATWSAPPTMRLYGNNSEVFSGFVYHSMQHRDPVRRQVHFLYKPHVSDTEDGLLIGAFRHYIYDEATDAFTQVWMNGLPNKNFRDRTGALIPGPSGHIYGNSTIDPATGDLYFNIYGRKYLSKYTAASGTWGHLPSTISGTITSPANGLVWHPHLFGTNDGGCVFAQGSLDALLYAWRKSTDTWSSIDTTARLSGRSTGVGTYFEVENCVLIGSTDEKVTPANRAPLMRIDAGATPTSTVLSVPPLNCCSSGSFDEAPLGYLMQHPNNPNKVLIVERPDTTGDGNRVYSSPDGDTWTQEANHPFDPTPTSGAIVMCSIPEYGIVWYVQQGTSAANSSSVIWKPAP